MMPPSQSQKPPNGHKDSDDETARLVDVVLSESESENSSPVKADANNYSANSKKLNKVHFNLRPNKTRS